MDESDKPKKKNRGPAPIIIRKEISDWIKKNQQNTHVNNNKKGGGWNQNRNW